MEDYYVEEGLEHKTRDEEIVGKASRYDSVADKIYDEVEEMEVMVKSEGLVSAENLLLIWGK